MLPITTRLVIQETAIKIRSFFKKASKPEDEPPPATGDDLSIIPVSRTNRLSSKDYADLRYILTEIQHSNLLLDLTQVRVVRRELFVALAADWDHQRPTKLGVRLSFVHWAILRGAIADEAHCLKTKNVELALFYEEQAFDAWYRNEAVTDNAPAVIAKLESSLEVSTQWPVLIDAATSLLERHPGPDRCQLLTKLAQIALAYGANKQAVQVSHEALLLVRESPTLLECQMRRTLGVAMLRLGEVEHGGNTIEDAITLAQELGAHEEVAESHYQLGSYALSWEEYARAERHFEAAISVMPATSSLLHARLYEALSLTVSRQGRESDSVFHATMAHKMKLECIQHGSTALAVDSARVGEAASSYVDNVDPCDLEPA